MSTKNDGMFMSTKKWSNIYVYPKNVKSLCLQKKQLQVYVCEKQLKVYGYEYNWFHGTFTL